MMGKKKLSEIKAEVAALLATLPGRSSRQWLEREINAAKGDADRDVESLRAKCTAAENPRHDAGPPDADRTGRYCTGRPFGGTHFNENTPFRRGQSIGANAAMADGSVHFLHQGISPKVLEALATIAGGEQITEDW